MFGSQVLRQESWGGEEAQALGCELKQEGLQPLLSAPAVDVATRH